MSAITGLSYLDGRPVDGADMGRMMEVLAYRGPDGSGSWCEASVGLGHQMLHTTPESIGEAYPMVHRGGSLVLTADARIDNREELIAQLAPGRPAVTDGELILAAYEKWGRACPEKLVGDFAFALWDSAEQHLFCARDHVGVKVLYYHHRPGRLFAFASEIKALLQLREVPRRVNERKVADYLGLIFLDNTDTFYEGIFRLPPGHTLTVSRHGIELQVYWALDPTRVLHLASDEAFAEAFREHFVEAVRCRLRSPGPVGAMLSGGLDSSSVTCVARDLLGDASRLHTFSVVYDEMLQCDESAYVQAVLAQGGVAPHLLRGDDDCNPLGDMLRILGHQGEPTPGHSMSMAWRTYDVVAAQGLRVALDGHGGDETVSHGGEYVHQLAREKKWLALAGEFRATARHGELSHAQALQYFFEHLCKHGPWPVRTARRAVRAAKRRAPALARQRKQQPRPAEAGNGKAADFRLFDPAFARRMDLPERYAAWRKTWPTAASNAQEHHYRTLTMALQPWALEMHEKMGAAHGLEIRVPFWDKRLVEFCLSLPPEQKRRQGWGRLVLRRAMEGILPPQVQWRADKINFDPMLERGMRADGRHVIEEAQRCERAAAYLDMALYRDLCARIHAANGDLSERDVSETLRATAVALWLRSL